MTREQPQPSISADDAGMSLVELIVVLFISALFLGLLASFMVQGLTAQAETTERDRMTGDGTVVMNSLTTSVRNSGAISIAPNGQSLVVRVATGASGWECRAWVLADGELRYRSSPTAINTANSTGWTALVPHAAGTLGDDKRPFAPEGARGVRIGLNVTVGDSTVALEGGATAQAVGEGSGDTPCW